MGYLDIKDRENVDEIISKTLSEFFGTKVTVSNQYSKNSFILNPRLSAAIHPKASGRVHKFIRREHAVHKNLFLKVAMDVYMRIGFSKKGWFGCKYLFFEKSPNNSQSLVIVPGNMKIKVVDVDADTIINICKKGFLRTGYEKELEARNGLNKPYVLPMKRTNNSFYTEQLLNGCTFSRLKKSKLAVAENAIYDVLEDFQKGNRNILPVEEYKYRVSEKLNNLFEVICYKDDFKNSIYFFVNKISDTIKSPVIISDSHGDFQNGNIFIEENGNIRIIDWETYGIRSILYDLLVFTYKLRYRRDYLGRIDEFFNDSKWESLSRRFCGTLVDKSEAFAIYVLEDIIWLLEEIQVSTEKKPGKGLIQYADLSFQKEVLSRLL